MGTLFFFLFFFCLPFCLLRGGRRGNFAISEETLDTFKLFLSAYQSSFTRGAYLTARAFAFAVGVSRWEIGPTETYRFTHAADNCTGDLPCVSS